MDKQRWEKIQAIFDQVADVDKNKQEQLLDKLCTGDEALKQEVVSLLLSDEQDLSFIEKPAAELINLGVSKISAGTKIGHYKIIKQIGYGGMGEVYLAEREDKQFKQKVALKIIKKGMDSSETLRRFHDERQILARLNHPHIARLYDGGMTADNLPYFTMEYIEGRPITDYCDRNELSVPERLELFCDVLAAVSYAHSNFIVHRDLKPGNIIVNSEGQVKLLDFGIAKLVTESELEDDNMTRTGFRVMTPGYASPEQIKGEAITTASDVYSLGVILYELLSGNQPFEIKGKTPGEIEQLICQTDPKRPSTQVTRNRTENNSAEDLSIISGQRHTVPEKLRRILKGDLDNICLKSLEKEPLRRYSSVEQLKDDIGRYLKGLPVLARPATYSYRAGKFVKRHSTAVFTLSSVTALIIFLVVYYTIQLSQERDKAQLEAQKAKKVSEYITSIFEYANPSVAKGETITPRDLVEQGRKRIDEELTDQPEVRVEMLKVISDVYYSMGDFEEARELSQEALQVMYEHDKDNIAGIAEIYHSMGDLSYDLGEFAQADSQYQRAYDLKKSVLSPDDTLIAKELIGLGTLARRDNNFEKSEKMYKEALRIQEASLEKPHLDIAYTMNNLGRLYQNNEMYDKAEPLLVEGLAMRRELLGDETFETIASMGSLASLYYNSKQLEKAEKIYQEAKENIIKIAGYDHFYTAGIIQSLANVEAELKKYDEAEKLYLKSIEILKKVLPVDHLNISYPLSGYGRLLVLSGRYDEGIKILDEALRVRLLALPEDDTNIAMVYTYLGRAYYFKEEYAKAESFLNKAYTSFESRLGRENKKTQEVVRYLVDLFAQNGDSDRLKTYQNQLISQK